MQRKNPVSQRLLRNRIGGESGIRTLGGFTHTAFRVLPAIPTMPENSGICEKLAELDKPLENTEFFAPLRRKFRRHQGFEPFPKSAQKAAFWRDFGEKTTVWREIRRELSAHYRLPLTIKNRMVNEMPKQPNAFLELVACLVDSLMADGKSRPPSCVFRFDALSKRLPLPSQGALYSFAVKPA